MVSKVLIDDQKAKCILICCSWLMVDESEYIFSTGGYWRQKSWVFEYDLIRKRTNMVWLAPDEPHVENARMSKSQVQVMAMVFFNCRGLVHLEWMPNIIWEM